MALRDKDRIRLNYAAAIAVSALAHAVLLYLALFALPRWFKTEETPPPAYTVAIVDNLPAGDLGTHQLPPLSGKPMRSRPLPAERPEKTGKQAPKKTIPVEAPDTDLKALALNATATAVATPEPTPTPTPQPVQTPEPTAAATPPAPPPSAMPTRRPRPRPTSRPEARKHNRPPHPAPKITPSVMLARVKPLPKALRTPSVKERLAMLRKQLMAEHLKELAQDKARRAEDESSRDESKAAASADRGAGGPVAGASNTSGRGYGVGSGSGSAGILKDPEFLLYYQKVQERIKDAWSFAGGSRELTTTVNFAIAPDGRLTGLEVAHSSNNASFDQSVLRAIRRAAPFPPPPEHYRDQFAQGVQAVFELGELSS